ncbi:MAG: glutamine--fructose-6-phosphate transaminase (isomerizing) [Methanosarcinales archaeon]|nr:glutamine--fructose-6-phosphate transaminase (isomerizing) [Methanosarcinales archaeon]
MCGIVGYIGNGDAIKILFESLKRLEYRGYDSAGLAVIDDEGNIGIFKQEGEISRLESVVPAILSRIGIGHTRWATHGKPTIQNAHPHSSGHISVVHNGIIENYLELKEELISEGYEFLSDTDTEVLAHLISKYYSKNLTAAVRQALGHVQGSYAIAVLCDELPGELVAARKDSPLIIGLGEQENFIASDIPAVLKYTNRIIYVENGEIISVKYDGIQVTDLEGNPRTKEEHIIEWDLEAAEKAGYPHFMLKEIHEQTNSIHETMVGRLHELEGNVNFEELEMTIEQIQQLQRIEIIACGTSYNAGLLGKYLFEKLAGIHTDVDSGSEFRYSSPVLAPSTLVIGITQSGETADTLAALQEAASYGCKTLAVTNVMGSSVSREASNTIYTRAGPEIGVAATKSFISQLVILYLLVIYFARIRSFMNANRARELLSEMRKIPGHINHILENKEKIHECASLFVDSTDYFFIGRNINYPIAMEGALKLKEISYIHAEGYAAGELKHGPLALISNNVPVVAIAPQGSTYDKILSNIKEVKAREASVIGIANQDDDEILKYVDNVLPIPKTDELLSPLLTTVVVQLLAYYTAIERNCSIDKPRNLAKSVTVE